MAKEFEPTDAGLRVALKAIIQRLGTVEVLKVLQQHYDHLSQKAATGSHPDLPAAWFCDNVAQLIQCTVEKIKAGVEGDR